MPPATPRPSALGGYEDWPGWMRGRPLLAGDPAAAGLAEVLGVPRPDGRPEVRAERSWAEDGVEVVELTWHVGLGPSTTAWVLRPAVGPGGGGGGLLPGILLLHCHAGVKSIGAERLVRTPGPTPVAVRLRDDLYGGRSLAADLARRGAVVLVHDTFAWGTRGFDLDPLPASLVEPVRRAEVAWAAEGVTPDPWDRYDLAAALHEHVVAKAAGLLGTSFAGMVAHDDLVALGVLRAQQGVDAARTAAVGFSGGGGRAAVLASLDPDLRAAVVAAMMTTTDALLPHYADAHSWLLTTPAPRGRFGLPEVAAARGAHRLLVLSFADDPIFPPDGVRAAHAELAERFAASRAGGSLEEHVLPGGHVLTVAAQDRVADFLDRALS
ncbi:acetylesterase [Actinotalea sp. K2]|uniref:dienelactone hydrolase family protein n=1 Tax=Actinotalea sp. K2 TaxID=2939438 RepID=UPI0020179B68|nr:acetylesterase [Actinotalea sp. K2]MCL3862974.1 acetylesterase [Actinotalea sp. K2]